MVTAGSLICRSVSSDCFASGSTVSASLITDGSFVISVVVADPTAPNRRVVLRAYTRNLEQVSADLGTLAVSIAPSLKQVMAAYATLGDGRYRRHKGSFKGSWGVVARTIWDALDQLDFSAFDARYKNDQGGRRNRKAQGSG